MCKFRKMLFASMAFLFTTSYVSAASLCSVEEVVELNREVVNIKANFEEMEGIKPKDEYDVPDAILGTPEEDNYVYKYNYFRINLTNLSDKFYAVITNDYNREKVTLKSSQAVDGLVGFDWKYLDKVTNFTIKIYATSKTNCEDELYRTLYLKTPRYNDNSSYAICSEATDHYLCQKYVMFKDVEYGFFWDTVNEYINKNNEEPDDESFFEKHKIAIIISVIVVIGAIGVATIYVIKKRRGNEI